MKNFKIITVENPTGTFIDCIVRVENLNDERIKVTTEYKNGFEPYVETMSIDNETFKSWYALNENKLIVTN